MFILILFSVFIAADIFWWQFAHRASKRSGLHAGWRWALGTTMLLTLGGLLLIIFARVIGMRAMIMPEFNVEIVYIWHLLVLPILTIASLGIALGGGLFDLVRRTKKPAGPPVAGVENPARRAFLTQALVIAPPVATLALSGKAMYEADDFVTTRTDLALKGLPPELDGMTIAFVSDPHVGSFMSDAKFKRIIDETNRLDADLVLHGGDLINHSLADLPDGIELLRRLRGRYGTFSCQGNHDRIENAEIFERETVRAGVGMLLDEAPVLRVRGYDVQILSPRWPDRRRDEESVMGRVDEVLKLRRDGAFPVLLAHHPHSFDRAVAANIPLTLAGHSHGGQIGLDRNLSVGRFMYRYWSGLYRQNDSAAYVSNGIGNWFPVRLNVPCELVHLTLRRA